MNAFVLIGIAQAIFLSGLLVVKKKRQVFDNILLAWLISNALQLYFFYQNFVYDTPPQNLFLIVGGVWPYFIAPLLYFYVIALVQRQPFRLLKNLYHFIPFIFMAASMLFFYFKAYPEQEIIIKDGYVHLHGHFPWHMRWYAMIMAFSSFFYTTISLILLFRHSRNIGNEFSYYERINLNWLKYWIILSIFGFWISFGIIHAAGFQLLDYISSFHTVAAILVINIFVIGFYGLRQTTIFTTVASPEVENDKKYKTSRLSKENTDDLLFKLESLMKETKPFLNNQLSIDDLAVQLEIKKHELSQLINESTNQNFYNYINGYRVSEFKERLVNPAFSHLSMLGIALESGFNSKSTFNHIFKKFEGITPTEYRNKLKK